MSEKMRKWKMWARYMDDTKDSLHVRNWRENLTNHNLGIGEPFRVEVRKVRGLPKAKR